MFFELLKRTLKKLYIDFLMSLAIENEHSIPMKSIRHEYDRIEKNELNEKMGMNFIH